MADEKKSGKQAVAEMLNVMESADRERLLTNIAAQDSKLAAELREQMFTFQDLLNSSELELQRLLREIPRVTWALALRGLDDAELAKIYRVMPQRAALDLSESIALLGPQKKTDVEKARAECVRIARSRGL